MATGRTVAKYTRIYVGQMGTAWQSKLCGLTRSLGPLKVAFDEIDATGMCDSIKGYLPGQVSINPGPINVILDPRAIETDPNIFMYPPVEFAVTNAFDIGAACIAQIPIGIRAAPVAGDPVFASVFTFRGMTYADDGGLVTVNFDLGDGGDAGYIPAFPRAWGQLLHDYGSEDAANSSAGIDSGAASTNGGTMYLQVFSSAGSTTFKVQHADANNDGSFADLTGASIVADGPGGFVATVPAGTSVKRYLRWQMTAVTNTFVMSFVRG